MLGSFGRKRRRRIERADAKMERAVGIGGEDDELDIVRTGAGGLDQPVALVSRSPGRAAPILPRQHRRLLLRRTDDDPRRSIIVWPRAPDVFKPGFIFGLEFRDDVRILRGHIVLLVRVSLNVKQLEFGPAGRHRLPLEAGGADELPFLISGSEVMVQHRLITAVALGKQSTVRPVHLLPRQQRPDAAPVELKISRLGNATDLQNCRDQVDVHGDPIGRNARLQLAGPVGKEW